MPTREDDLCAAAEKGLIGRVKSLLSSHLGLTRRARIDCHNYEGYTPLQLSIMYRQPGITRLLIDKGADTDKTSLKGSTPLMVCAKFGDAATARLLLDHGAHIDAIRRDEGGRGLWTALLIALANNNAELAKMLVDCGADFRLYDENGWTPLLYACNAGILDVVEALLARGAPVDQGDSNGWTPLMTAVREGHEAVVECLLSRDAGIDVRDRDGFTALMSAAKFGRYGIAERLVAAGADVNTVKTGSDKGWSSLTFAAWKGHSEIAELLIAHGAAVDSRTADGWTPMMWAIKEGHDAVVECLLSHGADAGAVAVDGFTALMAAAKFGRQDAARLLIARGADVNAMMTGEDRGWTSLLFAASNAHAGIAKLLVEHGADVNASERWGWTPLLFACREGVAGLAGILLDKGADIDATTFGGFDALHLAAFNDNLDLVGQLISYGAELNRTDMEGRTALSDALDKGLTDMAALLAGYGAMDGRERWSGMEAELQKIVEKRALRPCGNFYRILCDQDGAGAGFMALFADLESASKYYVLFAGYARRHPPTALFELMQAFAPRTILPEKHAVIFPHPDEEAAPAFREWLLKATADCNETLRPHNYLAGDYRSIAGSIETVLRWRILPPGRFDVSSTETGGLLTDTPGMGFPSLAVAEPGSMPPDEPDPRGEWIGVLFEISRFEEALYGRAAVRIIIDAVGLEALGGTVVRGGDILPEAKYWCTAVHTTSEAQLDLIRRTMSGMTSDRLAPECNRIITGDRVPVSDLVTMGFVTDQGRFVGSAYY